MPQLQYYVSRNTSLCLNTGASAVGGETSAAGGFPSCATSVPRAAPCGGSQGTFSGEASPEKLPPRCRRNAFGQGRMWRQATGVPDSPPGSPVACGGRPYQERWTHRKAWPFPLGRSP
ncbi:MAG: hypothetical protein KME49_12875 [Brasilonema octagenarum HA4186-MV1]|nr:hypothetical protein [Brasilonema octagenarum HA4186-MV1]